MAFRDRLRPASYRGVPFFVDEDALSGGKRAQVHEYPERDEWWVEELGRRAHRFRVLAHLLGEDVFDQRDRLIEACEEKGPATLVLPSREIPAVCERYRTRDSITGEIRITRVELTFVRAGRNQFPTATVDTRQAVLTQGDVAVDATADDFTAVFDAVAQPQWVVDAAVDLARKIVEGLEAAVSRAVGSSDEIANQLREIRALDSDIGARVLEPATLAQDLAGIYRAFSDLDAPGRTTLGELQTLAAVLDDAGTVPTGTATRQRQASNQTALQAWSRRIAAVEVARTVTRVALESAQDAAALREEVGAQLEADLLVAGDAGDDASFVALQDLLAETVRDLDTRGARLPRRRVFRVPATAPALVIAARLHDDPDRESEIVGRNRLRRPGFVIGGTELEVLSDAG